MRMFLALIAAWLVASLAFALGWVRISSSGRDNPFGLSFSPWNRNRPGFISELEAPWSAAGNWGSVVFGAIIGALIGATFWFFYVRVL